MKRTRKPIAEFAYEFGGQLYRLKASPKVVAAARRAYKRIHGREGDE